MRAGVRGVSSTFGARGRRFEKFGGGGVDEGRGAACCCCCSAGVKAEMASRATGPAAAGGLACIAAGASVTALGFRSHAVSDVCGMALRSSNGGARCGGRSIKALPYQGSARGSTSVSASGRRTRGKRASRLQNVDWRCFRRSTDRALISSIGLVPACLPAVANLKAG